MGLGDWFKNAASGGVIIETSLTPPFDAAKAMLPSADTSQRGDSVMLKILRPKVTIGGITHAPYGEPLPLWQIGLALLAIVVVRKIL